MAREIAQRCEWKYDESDDYYESACKEAWCFTEGGPGENKYKFCPFCGLKIKLVNKWHAK